MLRVLLEGCWNTPHFVSPRFPFPRVPLRPPYGNPPCLGNSSRCMDHLIVPYGRVNRLVSPEERQANKEESKRRWEEEQEDVFCGIVGMGMGRGFDHVPQPEIPTTIPLCCPVSFACCNHQSPSPVACHLLHAETKPFKLFVLVFVGQRRVRGACECHTSG